MSFESQFDFFHEQASLAAGGLTDFGDSSYQEPMGLLLRDCDANGNLGEVGKQLFPAEIIGMLVGRLRTQKGIQEYPEYLESPINRPLIIVGMARTGSTVLHRLLSEDPGNQALPLWLANNPMPRPPREVWESLPAFQQVAKGFERLYQAVPGIQELHPMIPGQIDECRFAFGQSFWNPGMNSMYCTPEYGEWCLNSDARQAYSHLHKVLRLISAGSEKRWVLKDPCHMWVLPTILETFPDACIVMTYREPLKALTSLTSLVYKLREKVEPGLTPKALGKEFLHYWGTAMARVDRDRRQVDSSRIFELHHDDIRHYPLESMERIYDYFNIPVSPEARQAWRSRIENNPNEGHGIHHYQPEDFGLKKEALQEMAGDYYAHYQEVENNRLHCS